MRRAAPSTVVELEANSCAQAEVETTVTLEFPIDSQEAKALGKAQGGVPVVRILGGNLAGDYAIVCTTYTTFPDGPKFEVTLNKKARRA